MKLHVRYKQEEAQILWRYKQIFVYDGISFRHDYKNSRPIVPKRSLLSDQKGQN